jgi:hypothetical protein
MWDDGQLDEGTGYTGIVRKGMRDEGQMDEGTGYTGIVRKGMRDEGQGMSGILGGTGVEL